MSPKSTKMHPKRHSRLTVFLLRFWHRCLIKNGSKKRPQNRARDDLYRARDDLLTIFWLYLPYPTFWSPKAPFWGHLGLIFEAPELNFRVILDQFVVFKCFNFEPCTSDTYSFRFCSFDKHILCLILSLPVDFRRSPSKQGRRWIAVRRLR